MLFGKKRITLKKKIGRWSVTTFLLAALLAVFPTADSFAEEKATAKTASNEEYATSGTCGEEAEWFINSDATLVIHGKGVLNKNGAPWPWNRYAQDIQRIVVEEGIEATGEGDLLYLDSSFAAFSKCKNITEVVFAPTVKNLYCCLAANQFDLKDIWIYAEDMEEDRNGIRPSNKGEYPRTESGTKWHVYAGSTTEQTLRHGLSLADDDIEYITEEQTFTEIKRYSTEKITMPADISSISGLLSHWEWDDLSKTLIFSGKGTITIPDGYYETYKEKAEHIIIESGITSIDAGTGSPMAVECPSGAFCGFTELKDVSLPDTLEKIEGGSFQNCSSLKKLVNGLPRQLKEIGNAAFRNSALSGDLVLPSAITQIGFCAFQHTDITSVKLIEGMILGGSAFKDCDCITEVMLPSLYYLPSLTDNAPRSNAAFADCANLEKVVIKGVGNVQYSQYQLIHENGIGDSLFVDCPSLKEVEIETENLEYIKKLVYNAAGMQDEGTFEMEKANPVFTIYKGSTTEATLREAGYLTEDNTKYYDVDTTALQDTVAEAEKIDTEKYTEESAKALQDALAQAHELLKQELPLPSLLKEKEQAVNAAMEALVEKPAAQTPGTGNNTGNEPGTGTNTGITPGTGNNTGNKPGTGTDNKPVTVKKVTLKKVSSPKKKTMKITWKRLSGVTGYEIQIGTNKKITKNKKLIRIKKAKTVSKTIKKLKSKKKYYVKIRAYKTVNGERHYGAWSKPKKVKVK